MVKIILISHGNLGKCLLETAAEICGCNVNEVADFTVSGKVNLEQIESEIKTIINTQDCLIFVDIFGGTASNIALKCAVGKSNVSVICGINLNMLLTALHNRENLNLNELAAKIITDGKKAILEATELIKK